jgi:hypothetical protein
MHLCETCRTRWRGLIICAACADLALSSSEASSEQDRIHNRQANASALLSGGAWLVGGLALGVLTLLSGRGSNLAVILTFLALMFLGGAGLLAAVGVGQAVAALRTSDGRNRVASGFAVAGLGLGGLYVALLLGAGLLTLWQT